MLRFALLSVSAFAQEQAVAPVEVAPPAEAPPAVVAAPPAAAPAPTDAELREAEARALYAVGLELMAQERFAEAEPVLRRVVADYPGSSVASGAALQLELLTTLGRGPAPRDRARSELAISQALIGAAFFGALVPGSTFQPDEPLVPVTFGLAGMGLGIGGSFWLQKHHPMTDAQAMALWSGEVLGAWNGFALSAINPPRDYRGVFRTTTAGTVLGAAGGVALGQALDLQPGQVAMVNTGAFWGTTLAAWSFAFTDNDDLESRAVVLRLLAGTDLGAAAGALAAWKAPVSRSRLAAINLSAGVGTAVAGGAAILLNYYGNLYEPEPTAALFLAGSAAGFATGVWLTRDMDTLSAPPTVSVAPAFLGQSPGLVVQGRF